MPRTAHAPRSLSALLIALTMAVGALVGYTSPTPAQAAPTTTVTKVAGDLTIPWDLTWIDGLMIYGERAGRLWTRRGSADPQRLDLDLPPIYNEGEAGLLGLVADPKASTNGHFYTCLAVRKANGDPQGVEVWKWKLTSDTTASKVKTLITGIPLNQSGRHSGCRLRFRSTFMLYVGTGDAAVGTNPQSFSSLGGKVLRVRSDGSIPTTNPFYARGGKARYIWTYGHRNIQGLVRRPGGEIWSVEHGTDRDDEVNRIYRGHNYGWSPTPGYNEQRAMTDKTRFPKATGAKWRSGDPTVATSGATFLTGSRWDTWNGRLAVAMLKGQGIRLFTVRDNRITSSQTRFTAYGRIRTAQQGPDGALYFTTSNGSGRDAIYRVTPG